MKFLPIGQYVSNSLIAETDQETPQLLFSEYFFSCPVDKSRTTLTHKLINMRFPKTPCLQEQGGRSSCNSPRKLHFLFPYTY